MERRFTIHDFEKSLKEQSDEFRMIPSTRVWHGIYNDLHPGRRWPSSTMSFLLVFSLLLIGYLNSNNKPHDVINAKSAGLQDFRAEVVTIPADKPLSQSVADRKAPGAGITALAGNGAASALVTPATLKGQVVLLASLPESGLPSLSPESQWMGPDPFLEAPSQDSWANQPREPGTLTGNTALSSRSGNLISNKDPDPVATTGNEAPPSISNERSIQLDKDFMDLRINSEIGTSRVASFNKQIKFNTAVRKSLNATRRLLMSQKFQNQKSSWLYYLTPQISSVTFNGSPISEPPNINYTTSVTIMPGSYKLLHYQAVGLEAGAQLNYRFARKLSFTSGFQLSYSGYNIISNEVHPTFATLFLRDPTSGAIYPRSYISHYGDGTGQTAVSLRNYSLQLAVPIGIAYEVAGNTRVQYNMAADIAPSLVVKSNAFILSSDGNNYVNDPTLMRRWNASSNFGFYVSFWSSRVKWEIGPNIRYQWLSTYKKDYSIGEHLVDYGIRIGISR